MFLWPPIGNRSTVQGGNACAGVFMRRERVTNRAKVQPEERVDLPPYHRAAGERPMMEMVAGCNVWYQATIQAESANELLVYFPGARAGAAAPLFSPVAAQRARACPCVLGLDDLRSGGPWDSSAEGMDVNATPERGQDVLWRGRVVVSYEQLCR